MDIPRGIGYVIAILIIILGIVVLPYGIILIFAAVPDDMGCVYRWEEKKSLKAFQKIEQQNQKLKLDQMKKVALQKSDDNEE